MFDVVSKRMSKDLREGNVTREELFQHEVFKNMENEEMERMTDKDIIDFLTDYVITQQMVSHLIDVI